MSSFGLLEKFLSFLYREDMKIISFGDAICDFSDRAIENDYNSMHLSNAYNLFSFKQLLQEQTQESQGVELLLNTLPLV